MTYTVEVTDTAGDPNPANWCVYLVEIPPVDGPGLVVTATSTAGYCDLNRNGEITYTITGFAPLDNLEISILDNNNGLPPTIIETIAPISDPYANSYLALPGDYQIIVRNLSDNCSDATGVIIDQNLPSIDI